MILALQISEHDAWIGLELVKLICEIEPTKRSDVWFVLAHTRFVNKFTVEDIVAEAKKKFTHVMVIAGKRHGQGWPVGCNDLWFEMMMRLQQVRKKLPHKWIATIEPDCIPLRSYWLDTFIDLTNSVSDQILGIGHIHGVPKSHLNGNAIFDLDIVKKLNLEEGDGMSGWDVWNRRAMMPHVIDTDEIYQIYRIKYFRPEQSLDLLKFGNRPALFHGIKGMLGIEAVRWMIANGHFK
jgi:hypothetical protein